MTECVLLRVTYHSQSTLATTCLFSDNVDGYLLLPLFRSLWTNGKRRRRFKWTSLTSISRSCRSQRRSEIALARCWMPTATPRRPSRLSGTATRTKVRDNTAHKRTATITFRGVVGGDIQLSHLTFCGISPKLDELRT